MKEKSGIYHSVYIKKDGEYISLEMRILLTFAKNGIKPVHPNNWDWTIRDFSKSENDPDINEARVIRDLFLKDLKKTEDSEIDLTGAY